MQHNLILALAFGVAAGGLVMIVLTLLRSPHLDRPLSRVAAVATALGDIIRRLWGFWGPRFTDRGFVAGVLAKGARLGMFSVNPEVLTLWTTALWVIANFFFPTWDGLPAGERLRPSRTALAQGVADRDALQAALREPRDELYLA